MEGEVSAFAEHVQLYKPLSKGNSWGLLLTQAPLEEGGAPASAVPVSPVTELELHNQQDTPG